MNLAEFKAWLEGYSASFRDGAPNAEQWAEIAKRLSEVWPISAPVLTPSEPLTKRPIPYWQAPVMASALTCLCGHHGNNGLCQVHPVGPHGV